ncbi:MAG: 1-acyl-sn-glycerol-3-phosphate acyltransferase [Rhizobiaceae bacterium]
MGSTVELPLWLVILAGILALAGLFDRLLNPAVQWVLRNRANRAIEELNSRLRLQLRPFKLTARQVLIDRLANDPAVVSAAEAHARDSGMPVAAALADAGRYAREIVPAFSAYTYFRIGARLARWVSTSLYRVRLAFTDRALLETLDTDATVVFVMNHRSNMDYILVTYMASTATALSYAVGEWARIPVLQMLIRSMGAYFIRRSSRNLLYRKVLARYVQMATQAGVTQAMFPEGGLSRDGKLRPVKLGLISYMVEGFDPNGRDVLFIPVGLNYDRVLEDRSLVAEIDGPPPKEPFYTTAMKTFAFLWRNLRLRLKGRWHKFGYACVAFGNPMSLKAFLNERDAIRFSALTPERQSVVIDALGQELMGRIGAVIPAMPVALVAHVLREAGGKGIDMLSLKASVDRLIDQLEAKGVHVHVPRSDRDYAVTAGLRMFTLRNLVSENNGLYQIVDGEEQLVAYYANSLAHFGTPEKGAAKTES